VQRCLDQRHGRAAAARPVKAIFTNLYAYTGGDPVNNIDPSGLDDAGLQTCPGSRVVDCTEEMSAREAPTGGPLNLNTGHLIMLNAPNVTDARLRQRWREVHPTLRRVTAAGVAIIDPASTAVRTERAAAVAFRREWGWAQRFVGANREIWGALVQTGPTDWHFSTPQIGVLQRQRDGSYGVAETRWRRDFLPSGARIMAFIHGHDRVQGFSEADIQYIGRSGYGGYIFERGAACINYLNRTTAAGQVDGAPGETIC
jgi:hypothetical protein